MGTSTKHDGVAVCSVSEMARRLGLSRARFYQLVNRGVFPPPVRSNTHRPFYSLDLQQQCLAIRKTRVGFNGLPVLFNRSRRRSRGKSAGQYEGLVAALVNMGLKANMKTVRQAIRVLYPAGPTESQDEILRNLFRHFTEDCQKSV